MGGLQYPIPMRTIHENSPICKFLYSPLHNAAECQTKPISNRVGKSIAEVTGFVVSMRRYSSLIEACGNPENSCLVYIELLTADPFNAGAIFHHDGLQAGAE
jgi:hypothetical protein